MGYYTNKANAVTRDTTPTKTDQAGADETNINVIVKRYGTTGTVPGPGRSPITGDFSDLPTDLREMLEASKSVERLRRSLPDTLREKPLEQLLTLTQDELTRILTPQQPNTPEGTTA